jgi:uncharacterized protein DUF1549/uncharacterized protein DUF1553
MLRLLFVLAAALVAAGRPQDGDAPLDGPALIDRHIGERWKAQGAKPAAPSDDSEFLRRVWLDVGGVIPPADVTLRFLADRRPGKRERMVDELLASPHYAAHWAELWEAVLVGYDPRNPAADTTLGIWMRDEVFGRNLPYDEFARRLLSARGSNRRNPAAIYWTSQMLRGRAVNDIGSRATQVFLGTQIHCAQCHDHPFDRYTQEDYVSTVAFFVRARQRKTKPYDDRDQEYEVFDAPNGEAQYPPDGPPRQRRNIPPKYFDESVPVKDEGRRDAFARIVTRRENLQFAVALVNRYWGHFFGRGLVHPIDDFNLKNKPSHPYLMTELAQAFAERRFDLKWLVKSIALSRAYQLSSRRPEAAASADERLFAAALVRTMTPEQLFNSLSEALGVEDRYQAMERSAEGLEQADNERRNYIRQFRFTFGDDEQVDVLDFDGTIPQALTMLNGDLINRRMRDANSRLDLILRTRREAKERLELIFVSALSRPPRTAERERLLAHIADKGDKREAYEDVMWALLNSSEFFFIH